RHFDSGRPSDGQVRRSQGISETPLAELSPGPTPPGLVGIPFAEVDCASARIGRGSLDAEFLLKRGLTLPRCSEPTGRCKALIDNWDPNAKTCRALLRVRYSK